MPIVSNECGQEVRTIVETVCILRASGTCEVFPFDNVVAETRAFGVLPGD